MHKYDPETWTEENGEWLVSIAASTLMVTGGQLTTLEYHLTYEWNQAIYTEALVLSLTALLWHQLHRLNKQDKSL